MMYKDKVEELAASYAKEIVIAKASNTTLGINAEGGKKVAEFYSEIFKGISETLKNAAFTHKTE